MKHEKKETKIERKMKIIEKTFDEELEKLKLKNQITSFNNEEEFIYNNLEILKKKSEIWIKTHFLNELNW